jgi:arabinogalactan oligomer/maltooligosaccharide transport system permease protein
MSSCTSTTRPRTPWSTSRRARSYYNVEGTFTSESGKTLTPGFAVTTGLDNYRTLFTDPTLRTTFVQVFLWTVIFALMSVFLTFVLGMFLAIVFDVPEMPLRRRCARCC